MLETALPVLTQWSNYYVIIGSAAAALTGLQFVVVTLIARIEVHESGEGIAAFGTPTVVHFCAALGVAAILSAPWRVLWHAAFMLGVCGLAGLGYVVVVVRRVRRQSSYSAVLEDWFWHVVLPSVSYVAIAGAALLLPSRADPTLFVVAGATVLLVFVGIHNAWDTVAYMVVDRSEVQAGHGE